MKLDKLERMIGGWFVGNFDCAYKTDLVEVSYKVHPKGEQWDIHYHEHVTEINLLVRGKMLLHKKELVPGDIFTLSPYEVAEPEFLEDCEIVCVKLPGIRNDKISLVKK